MGGALRSHCLRYELHATPANPTPHITQGRVNFTRPVQRGPGRFVSPARSRAACARLVTVTAPHGTHLHDFGHFLPVGFYM